MNHLPELASIDLHGLALFRSVAKLGSFTRAARSAGLTQSAVSRQVQNLEAVIGVPLLERTTRQVRLTPAGSFLAEESGRISRDLEEMLLELRTRHESVARPLRIGVSSTLGQAYLPGFFHAHLKRCPEIACRVRSEAASALPDLLMDGELDAAILDSASSLPAGLTTAHRFQDPFILIGPAGQDLASTPWQEQTHWLLLSDDSTTGAALRAWMAENGGLGAPLMEFDSFDLIIGLVSLGMGVSWVPRRSLAPYPKGRFRQHRPPQVFTREIVVLARKQHPTPERLARFIENILFS